MKSKPHPVSHQALLHSFSKRCVFRSIRMARAHRSGIPMYFRVIDATRGGRRAADTALLVSVAGLAVSALFFPSMQRAAGGAPPAPRRDDWSPTSFTNRLEDVESREAHDAHTSSLRHRERIVFHDFRHLISRKSENGRSRYQSTRHTCEGMAWQLDKSTRDPIASRNSATRSCNSSRRGGPCCKTHTLRQLPRRSHGSS